MSNRYVVLAKVREKLEFFFLRSNADPKALKQAAARMLKARYGRQPFEFVLTSDSKVA